MYLSNLLRPWRTTGASSASSAPPGLEAPPVVEEPLLPFECDEPFERVENLVECASAAGVAAPCQTLAEETVDQALTEDRQLGPIDVAKEDDGSEEDDDSEPLRSWAWLAQERVFAGDYSPTRCLAHGSETLEFVDRVMHRCTQGCSLTELNEEVVCAREELGLSWRQARAACRRTGLCLGDLSFLGPDLHWTLRRQPEKRVPQSLLRAPELRAVRRLFCRSL